MLPGIGPVATIAMLLPTTHALQPVSALIMLAGIYYGAQYGGSTTSIKLLKVPYRLLYPAILLFCSTGVYSINHTHFDVSQTAVFGLLGVVFLKLECEPAPLLLGFVLGPMMEENLRRAMLLSRGDSTVFSRGRFR